MGSRIIANTDTIDEFSNEVLKSSNELSKIIDNLTFLTQDYDQYFDTKTGRDVKEFLMNYLAGSQKECKKLEEYGYTLKQTSEIYKIAYNYEAREVGGNNG